MEKWLLNWKKNGENFIVHVTDDFQITGLSSVDVHLFEEKLGSLWDFNIHKQEIFDLSEESNKYWIKIDSDESNLGLFSIEEVFVELVLGVLLNSMLPLNNLLFVVLSQIFAEGDV